MDFSDVIKNFKAYYPPENYFCGPTGPPTLLASNLLSKPEFEEIVSKINLSQYLKLLGSKYINVSDWKKI